MKWIEFEWMWNETWPFILRKGLRLISVLDCEKKSKVRFTSEIGSDENRVN